MAIFKGGLHYLATFKLFQRMIFACLMKDIFHVKTISFIVMVKIFFRFSSLDSVVISPSVKTVAQ